MKPEHHAWLALEAHAASRLRPGFAERTIRAAREEQPSFRSHCLLSAATAVLALTAIVGVNAHLAAVETARNLAAWQEIATQAAQLAQLQ